MPRILWRAFQYHAVSRTELGSTAHPIDTLKVPVSHYRIYFGKTCKYISCTANKNFFVRALINASRIVLCIARYRLLASINMLRAGWSTPHQCDSIDRRSHSRAMARNDRRRTLRSDARKAKNESPLHVHQQHWPRGDLPIAVCRSRLNRDLQCFRKRLILNNLVNAECGMICFLKRIALSNAAPFGNRRFRFAKRSNDAAHSIRSLPATSASSCTYTALENEAAIASKQVRASERSFRRAR